MCSLRNGNMFSPRKQQNDCLAQDYFHLVQEHGITLAQEQHCRPMQDTVSSGARRRLDLPRRSAAFMGTLGTLAVGAVHRLTLMQIWHADPLVRICWFVRQESYCIIDNGDDGGIRLGCFSWKLILSI